MQNLSKTHPKKASYYRDTESTYGTLVKVTNSFSFGSTFGRTKRFWLELYLLTFARVMAIAALLAFFLLLLLANVNVVKAAFSYPPLGGTEQRTSLPSGGTCQDKVGLEAGRGVGLGTEAGEYVTLSSPGEATWTLPRSLPASRQPVSRTSVDGLPMGGAAVWVSGTVQSGAVLLFRRAFALADPVPEAELDIIADTRYELWLDGHWIGRGPARFSEVRQEYDTHALGTLAPGEHILAVLVHYAPNSRRSDDLGGGLQASLRVKTDLGWISVVETDDVWRALLSPAWNAEAKPISSLGLIGPMELLDLRLLPPDWMDLAYDDTNWAYAHVLQPSPFDALTPRTIPLLVDIPHFPLALVESGLLSPGCNLVELEEGQYGNWAFTVVTPTVLRVEALDMGSIALDGWTMHWQALQEVRRPDVLVAEREVSAGEHTLLVSPSDEGRTLALCLENGVWEALPPLRLTRDPGRRMLLGNPTPPLSPPRFGEGNQGGRASLAIVIPEGDTPRYLLVDFGRTLHARVVVTAEGPSGTIIDAGWDERLTEGRALPAPGSLMDNLWRQVDSWVLDGTPRVLTTLDARSGRYLLLQIFGPGPVTLSGLHAAEEVYPVQQRGSFASSDPRLDQIWQVGVDTLTPNMTDAYTDTPWRERGQWWGDAFVSFYINAVSYGDTQLFRRGLRQIADAMAVLEGRPVALAPHDGGMLLDYGLLWLEGLYRYWRLTGDQALLEELYPTARQLADFLAAYESDAGLLNIPLAHWSESALVDWSAETSRSGESTALNALYVAALQSLGEMAEAVGDDQRAQHYAQKSVEVQDAINRVLFMPGEGAYAASRYEGEVRVPSPHAQAYALRYNIVPSEAQSQVSQALVRQLSPFFDERGWAAVETYGMFWVLDGLGQSREAPAALALIRKQYGRLLDLGATTWWEVFTPNQWRWQSLSHAWSGAPTWFLSTYVLGAQVLDPTTWRVAPQPAGLSYAQGGVPVVMGTLQVSWQCPHCGDFRLMIQAPEHTQGEVVLPVSHNDVSVILDGAIVWSGGAVGETYQVSMEPEGLTIHDLEGGNHEVLLSFTCYETYIPTILLRPH